MRVYTHWPSCPTPDMPTTRPRPRRSAGTSRYSDSRHLKATNDDGVRLDGLVSDADHRLVLRRVVPAPCNFDRLKLEYDRSGTVPLPFQDLRRVRDDERLRSVLDPCIQPQPLVLLESGRIMNPLGKDHIALGHIASVAWVLAAAFAARA